MSWDVIEHDDYTDWLTAEPVAARREIAIAVSVLEEFGPQLGRPYVDTVHGSDFDNMKELRFKVRRSPYRILFAFDPARRAILLVGGDKGRDKRWYKVNIPIADARFREHLAELKDEEADG